MAAKPVSSASLLSSSASKWLASAWTAIQNDTSSTAGLMGMLASSNNSSAALDNASTNLALISQSNTSKATAFYAQIASQNQKARQKEKLDKAMADLQSSQTKVTPKNVLDPYIYFNDGSNLDTAKNILTKLDGTQYDMNTGLEYIDPANTLQLANGAYIDTKNNIMHMSDGTKIDTVTGLKIPTTSTKSVTA